ncbi:transposase [Corynebacterium diphtheriae]|nr:transposase [Corynebacterium diphtheriae]OJH92866.1 transposase [Corynebacterium diphtheriae]
MPDSTAPLNPRRVYDDTIRQQVLQARGTLQARGQDCGPWSIFYFFLDELGYDQPPSRALIAQWLHEAGVADINARKRPRKSYKDFARGEVNELWQIDAFVYRLFAVPHTHVTIYQVVDDASRFDVGSQAFGTPENGTDARIMLSGAIDTYGLPQEVLSDNGDSFATYHRGRLPHTERWLASLKVQSSAGFAPMTLAQVQQLIVDYRNFYNTRRRHQGLLRGKMHITPAQAWEIISHAQPPTQPIDPDVLWTKIAKHYHRIHPDNRVDALAVDTVVATDNALPEVAASGRAPGNDTQAIQQDTPYADSLTVMPSSTGVNALWPIPDKLWINKSGVVRVMGHGLYVGLRFKNRAIYSSVADDYVEFFTDHDGEKLFSFPLPIQLNQRPPGGQININHVVGMWHRQHLELKSNLSGPRSSRRKEAKLAPVQKLRGLPVQKAGRLRVHKVPRLRVQKVVGLRVQKPHGHNS